MTEKQGTPQGVVVAGILGLALLGMTALVVGQNGLLLTTIVGVIGLAIGVAMPQFPRR